MRMSRCGYSERDPAGNVGEVFFSNDVGASANGVYYPNWRIYKDEPPSSLTLGLISHVFYSFAWVKQCGTIYVWPMSSFHRFRCKSGLLIVSYRS